MAPRHRSPFRGTGQRDRQLLADDVRRPSKRIGVEMRVARRVCGCEWPSSLPTIGSPKLDPARSMRTCAQIVQPNAIQLGVSSHCVPRLFQVGAGTVFLSPAITKGFDPALPSAVDHVERGRVNYDGLLPVLEVGRKIRPRHCVLSPL